MVLAGGFEEHQFFVGQLGKEAVIVHLVGGRGRGHENRGGSGRRAMTLCPQLAELKELRHCNLGASPLLALAELTTDHRLRANYKCLLTVYLLTK